MDTVQIHQLKVQFVMALMKESREAWEAGAQNCPGPISMSDADALVSDIFASVANNVTLEVG